PARTQNHVRPAGRSASRTSRLRPRGAKAPGAREARLGTGEAASFEREVRSGAVQPTPRTARGGACGDGAVAVAAAARRRLAEDVALRLPVAATASLARRARLETPRRRARS